MKIFFWEGHLVLMGECLTLHNTYMLLLPTAITRNTPETKLATFLKPLATQFTPALSTLRQLSAENDATERVRILSCQFECRVSRWPAHAASDR